MAVSLPQGERAAAAALLVQAAAFPPGSPEYEWRRRAAWKLDQIARGIPFAEHTKEPGLNHGRTS